MLGCGYRSLILCACAAWSTAFGQQLTIIELRHRSVEELIPVLQPLLKPETALSGADYRLLARGDAAEIARIREALAVLDRAPKQLLITARYATRSEMAAQRDAIAARIGNAGVQATIATGRDSERTSGEHVSSLRMLEGQAAYIANGVSVPIVSAGVDARGRVGAVVERRELASGLRVQPRVNGDAVILEISAQQERLQSADAIAVQRVNTSVSGRLDEWLAVAGADETSRSRSTGIGARRIETASDARELWIKVELIP